MGGDGRGWDRMGNVKWAPLESIRIVPSRTSTLDTLISE